MSDTPIYDELYCSFVVTALFADLADEWGCAE